MRWLLIISLCSVASGASPATQPSDATVDWLLSQAATAPAIVNDDVLTTQPAVLVSTNAVSLEARPGAITLSDGTTHVGKLSTTLRQPIRVWDDQKKQYADLPFSLIQSIDAHVVWERDEREWKFKESGSDVKEYSGRTYPSRLTEYSITLTDGSTFTGPVAAPIYYEKGDVHQIYILHKTASGQVGEAMAQLIYVRSVRFLDVAAKETDRPADGQTK